MKVIIFGGSGFVGSHLADVLSDAGYKVKIFDRQVSAYLRSDQEMIIGDILDKEAVVKSMVDCDYVYNFAGFSDLDDATTKALDTIRQNIEGNAVILEAAKEAKIKRFVYASTIYVYSEKGGFYRCSKQAAESYVEEFQRKYNISFTILRFGTLYGTRSNKRNSVYRYVYDALNTGKISCSGRKETLREYINVKDAARLARDILDDKYKNNYVIISGHHPITFGQLLETIKEMCNDKIKIELSPVQNEEHYTLTPYSFTPKLGYKLTSNLYTDIGQGLLEVFSEIYKELKLNDEKGVLL
jgi:UDP-glucose 4-epimerase